MTGPIPAPKGVIRRDAVQLVAQPAMVGCAPADGAPGSISVVPLLDGDRVAGLDVRCSCGARALVECVYQSPAEVEP